MISPGEKEYRAEAKAWWKALPESEKQLFLSYVAERGYGDSRVRKERRMLWVLIDTGLCKSTADWVARQREGDKRKADQDEKETQEKQQRRIDFEARKSSALDALARGEHIPAKYRPVGGRCICCLMPLRDPVSVRWGIGPDCIEQQPDIPFAEVKARYRREKRSGVLAP